MGRGLWKTYERKVAKFFNTNRTPLSGINSRHDTHSDTLHPKLYIEVKSVSTVNSSNGWIMRWLRKLGYPKEPQRVEIASLFGNAYLFHSQALYAKYEQPRKCSALPMPGVGLWIDIDAKSIFESKLPLLVLCVKGKHGFWIVGFADAILAAQKVRAEIEEKA